MTLSDTGSGFEESSKKKKQPALVSVTPSGPSVVVDVCPMFDETFTRHVKDDDQLKRKLGEFIAFKINNPIGKFGSKDSGDAGNMFGREVEGIRHAYITHNLRIWYTISGLNPRHLRLYAVLSHDESGTGQPNKVPVMRNVAKQMGTQSNLFKPYGDRR